VHDTQTPALHTMFAPHEVPLATSADSVQTTAPVVHEVVPVRHGFPLTVQVAPTLQVMHTPALVQTLSVQVGVPVEQASAPA